MPYISYIRDMKNKDIPLNVSSFSTLHNIDNKKSYFQLQFRILILSLISIINVHNCSLQGERRCGVCQMLNKWFLYTPALQDITVTRLEAPGQQTPGQRCGKKLPGMPCIPRVGVRLALQQASGHCHAFCVWVEPSVSGLNLSSAGPGQVEPLGFPGQESFHVQTSLLRRIHNIIQIRTLGEKLPGHIHFHCFVKYYGP